jgi:Glycine zipper 2TM domain
MTNSATKFSVAVAMGFATILTSTPVMAHGHRSYSEDRYEERSEYNDGYYRNNGYSNNGYNDGYYRNRDDRGYRDYNGRRCGKSGGTTGLIVGGVVGGLLGRAVVGRYGDRTAGTIIGAGAGALAGRAVERSDSRRC